MESARTEPYTVQSFAEGGSNVDVRSLSPVVSAELEKLHTVAEPNAAPNLRSKVLDK